LSNDLDRYFRAADPAAAPGPCWPIRPPTPGWAPCGPNARWRGTRSGTANGATTAPQFDL